MKKLPVLLLSILLSVFMIIAAGCSTENEYVKNSLHYHIDTSYTYTDDIDGTFKIKVNSGIVTNVKFTVKGFDENGKGLWVKDFNESYKGLKAQNEPYEISFSYSYSTGVIYLNKRTDSVTVTSVKIITESSNEWMGWTFGAVSIDATLAVIALFIVSKIISARKKSSENPEE